MSEPSKKKKNAPKEKTPSNEGPSVTTVAVQAVVAHACHLGEVAAIVRAAAAEFVIRFNGDDYRLPELLLQRKGSGARPATVEAIMAAELALGELARDLEARARALLKLPVDVGDVVDPASPVTGIGFDHVVHRDLLEGALRSGVEKKT